MEYHGITMLGDLNTDNVKAKDTTGLLLYNSVPTAIMTLGDAASGATYIRAYTGTAINEFSTDTSMAGDSNDALPTERAVKRYVDNNFQPLDSDLTTLAGLTPTDGNFIVGNGSAWIVESGLTAIASLGMATYLTAPDPIGSGTPSTGKFTTLETTGATTLGTTATVGTSVTVATNTVLTGTTLKLGSSGTLQYNQSSPTGTAILGYNGYLYATRIYNAVYNDIADWQDLNDELMYGKCYIDTKKGARIATIRCQKGLMGIASDTYGQSCGIDTDKIQVPVSIAGWVLAYVDKEYEPGTPLTNDANGNLTEMRMDEKTMYPERLVATYKKPEDKEYWNNIVVNGRHWVKVR